MATLKAEKKQKHGEGSPKARNPYSVLQRRDVAFCTIIPYSTIFVIHLPCNTYRRLPVESLIKPKRGELAIAELCSPPTNVPASLQQGVLSLLLSMTLLHALHLYPTCSVALISLWSRRSVTEDESGDLLAALSGVAEEL